MGPVFRRPLVVFEERRPTHPSPSDYRLRRPPCPLTVPGAPAPGSRARRASALRSPPARPGPRALAASLALSPGALGPATVAAQAGGPQVVIERPAPGSEVRGTVVVGGWAADPTDARGSGIAADSVQAWLRAPGTGRPRGTG